MLPQSRHVNSPQETIILGVEYYMNNIKHKFQTATYWIAYGEMMWITSQVNLFGEVTKWFRKRTVAANLFLHADNNEMLNGNHIWIFTMRTISMSKYFSLWVTDQETFLLVLDTSMDTLLRMGANLVNSTVSTYNVSSSPSGWRNWSLAALTGHCSRPDSSVSSFKVCWCISCVRYHLYRYSRLENYTVGGEMENFEFRTIPFFTYISSSKVL